jgi:choline dehydrogenase-like flavoprotein
VQNRFDQEAEMTRIAKSALVLGALCAGALASPALGRTAASDPGDMGAKCHQQVVGLLPQNHDNFERHREFAMSACMTNGGTIPGR